MRAKPVDTSAVEIGGGSRTRTGVDGFAGRCMTTLPSRPARSTFTYARQAAYCLRRTASSGVCQQVQTEKGKWPGTACAGHNSSPFFLIGIWSGKRVSNSRPQPWQGCALPTELFPQQEGAYSRVCAARVKPNSRKIAQLAELKQFIIP